MAQDTPSRKLDQYIVRFPDGMRDRLKAAAATNNRSLNAEIVSRLERSLFGLPSTLEALDVFDPAGFDTDALRELTLNVQRLVTEVQALGLNAKAAPKSEGKRSRAKRGGTE